MSSPQQPWPNDQPDPAQPDAAQPDPTQPDSTQGRPDWGQPYVEQPEAGQPQFSQPDSGQPQFSQPDSGQPQFSQPDAGQPQPVNLQKSDHESSPQQYGQPQGQYAEYGQPQGQYGQYGQYGQAAAQQYPTQQYPGQQYPPAEQGAAPYWQGQPGYPPPTGQMVCLADGTPLANVWMRLLARIIDSFLLSLIMLVPMVLLIALFGGLGALVADSSSSSSYSSSSSSSGGGEALLLGGAVVLYLLMFVMVAVICYFYVIVRTRKVGATFGKQMLGLRIRPVFQDGQLTQGQVWSRTLLMYLASSFTSGITGLIDALWCLWDPARQCVHDKVAGTVVIATNQSNYAPDSPEVLRARSAFLARGWVANGPDPLTRPGYPH